MTRHQKYCKEAEELWKETVEKDEDLKSLSRPKDWWKDKNKLDKYFERFYEVMPVRLSLREEQLYNHGWQCLKDYKNKKIDLDKLLDTKIKVIKGYNANGEKLDGKTFRFTELTWPSGSSGINGRIGLLRKLEISENFENE